MCRANKLYWNSTWTTSMHPGCWNKCSVSFFVSFIRSICKATVSSLVLHVHKVGPLHIFITLNLNLHLQFVIPDFIYMRSLSEYWILLNMWNQCSDPLELQNNVATENELYFIGFHNVLGHLENPSTLDLIMLQDYSKCQEAFYCINCTNLKMY